MHPAKTTRDTSGRVSWDTSELLDYSTRTSVEELRLAGISLSLLDSGSE